MTWLVIDMDEGVRGAFEKMRDAVKEFTQGCPHERYSYGPGAYEYRWWFPGDRSDGDSFFLERLERAQDGGWGWAVRAWEKKGKPMGRLAEPCGRDEQWRTGEEEFDYAEPAPDTIGAASRTAKCHHCGERIHEDISDEWVHTATSDARCGEESDG